MCLMAYRLLLQSKHVVIEELVQLFVSEVYAQLLKGVVLRELYVRTL